MAARCIVDRRKNDRQAMFEVHSCHYRPKDRRDTDGQVRSVRPMLGRHATVLSSRASGLQERKFKLRGIDGRLCEACLPASTDRAVLIVRFKKIMIFVEEAATGITWRKQVHASLVRRTQRTCTTKRPECCRYRTHRHIVSRRHDLMSVLHGTIFRVLSFARDLKGSATQYYVRHSIDGRQVNYLLRCS